MASQTPPSPTTTTTSGTPCNEAAEVYARLYQPHGKPCFYLRRPGHKKVRLPGLPWSPEFMAAREAALKGDWIEQEVGAKRTVAGTVNAAIVSYYQTSAFKDGLAESHRKCAVRSSNASAKNTATSGSR